MVSAGASFESLSLDRQPTTGSGKERPAPRRARRDRNRAPQARARGEEAGGMQRTPRGYASAQRPRANPCRGVCAGCTTPCRPASGETDESKFAWETNESCLGNQNRAPARLTDKKAFQPLTDFQLAPGFFPTSKERKAGRFVPILSTKSVHGSHPRRTGTSTQVPATTASGKHRGVRA